MSKDLMPSLTTDNHLDTETGEIKTPKYVEGNPRQYRFDASKGVLNLNGIETITKPGDHIRMLPIALRIFRADLFEMGNKEWVEIAFINCKNQLGVVMLHGFSVENLLRESSELFYEDLEITECIMTIKPFEKTIKQTGNKFYICEFTFEAAEKNLVQATKAAVEHLKIYRMDTLKPGQRTSILQNWYVLPVSTPCIQNAEPAPAALSPATEPVQKTEIPVPGVGSRKEGN
jgi:hypothetical protein